jgi:hypothetical protein
MKKKNPWLGEQEQRWEPPVILSPVLDARPRLVCPVSDPGCWSVFFEDNAGGAKNLTENLRLFLMPCPLTAAQDWVWSGCFERCDSRRSVFTEQEPQWDPPVNFCHFPSGCPPARPPARG